MKFILATNKDLNKIKDIYSKIVENMYANDIKIWNKYYPNEVFAADIENKSLYLLKDKENILGAFVLDEHKDIEIDIEWEDNKAKAYLLNRVGVNVEYLRQGIGQKLLEEAYNIAKTNGAKYLRLLVSEDNTPAINLYAKCKFNKVKGIHVEKIRDDFSLNEYGFEIRIKENK